MGQQVLNVQDAPDIVTVILIDGDTRVVVLDDALQHLLIGSLEIKVYHILPRGHHLLGRLIAKAYDALQHALLLLDVLLVGQLKGLLQVVNAQHAVFLLHHFLRQTSRRHDNAGKGIKQTAEEHDATHGHPAELKRTLPGIDLWHYLAKEQQEEGQQHRNAQELQPPRMSEVDSMVEEVSTKHDNGDVDQVVGNEDGGQRPFRLLTQLHDGGVGVGLFCIQVV